MTKNIEELIGKYYQLLNIDNSIMISFKITHAKNETRPMINHDDGSSSPPFTYSLVSDNGHAWYRIYGGATDRILTEADYNQQTQPAIDTTQTKAI